MAKVLLVLSNAEHLNVKFKIVVSVKFPFEIVPLMVEFTKSG